jgi:flagellin FlaB
MRRIKYSSKNSIAAIGIGALIIFIALILLAGIAATILIETSATLELQASKTGKVTTVDVASGIEVYGIEGFADNLSDISKLAILVRPRAGSDEINLKYTVIELTNTSKKVIMNYTDSFFLKPDGLKDIFTADTFPDDGTNFEASKFGILVLEDADNSVSSTSPIINRGDKVYLCVNVTACFNDIAERTDIWGMVLPEDGFPGLIEFRTPSTYDQNVFELQLDL